MMALRPLSVLSAFLQSARLRPGSARGSARRGVRVSAAPMLLAGVAALGIPAGQARADMPGLALSQGDIFSDPVGSVIGVSITNNGSAPLGSAVVTCAFSAGGRPAGSASTNLYNILPGQKGQDQVHMMGVKADKATCSITATTPATN